MRSYAIALEQFAPLRGRLPLLGVCAALLLAQGCAADQRVVAHSLFTECRRPVLAALPELDETAHIGGAANVRRLLEIIDAQTRELNDFSAALACYEAQARNDEGPEATAPRAVSLSEASSAPRMIEGGIHDR